MEIIERILGKLVGEEVKVEEMELIAGARIDACTSIGGTNTWSGGTPYSGGWECDM